MLWGVSVTVTDMQGPCGCSCCVCKSLLSPLHRDLPQKQPQPLLVGALRTAIPYPSPLPLPNENSSDANFTPPCFSPWGQRNGFWICAQQVPGPCWSFLQNENELLFPGYQHVLHQATLVCSSPTPPPLSFLFSGGGRGRHTGRLPHSCSLSPAFSFSSKKTMITNRHHAETMPDLYFPPSYRYARPSLPQTCFWTQGHPVSFSQGYRAQGHWEFWMLLTGILRNSSSLSINFEHSIKTFPAWACSWAIMNITLYLQAKVTMIHAYTMGIVNCFQLLCQLCPFYCGNVRHVAKVRMSGKSVLFLQRKLWHLPQATTGLFLDLPQERPTHWALIWSMSRGIIYS